MRADWEKQADEPQEPSSPGGLRLLALLGAALVAAVVLSQLFGGEGSTNAAPGPRIGPVPTAASPTATGDFPNPPRPIGAESMRRCPVRLGALTLNRSGLKPGAPLSRWDCSAGDGPWSVVVRRTSDGSLARNGAVISWPLSSAASVGTTLSSAARQAEFTWQLEGESARIRGDLPREELRRIAERVTVTSGRLVLRNPPQGYTVISSGPRGSALVHELRYGSSDLGQEDALGDGLTFTGVLTGGGFEEELYAEHAAAAGMVAGRPAVYSTQQLGNALLAWEPSPGVVAYVGYSGTGGGPEARAALRALAASGRMLTAEQFDQASR